MKCEIWGEEASTYKEALKKGSSFYGMGTMISNKVSYFYYFIYYNSTLIAMTSYISLVDRSDRW